jgi:hypothetical protein
MILHSFIVDQVQGRGQLMHFFNNPKDIICIDEITILIRKFIFNSNAGYLVHINGYQQLFKHKTLSFNLSNDHFSNFGKGISLSQFRIKMLFLSRIFNKYFNDFKLKKIEIAVDTDQIFFKNKNIQLVFFKKFDQAVKNLFTDMGFTEINTTIHTGVVKDNGEFYFKEQNRFLDNIKSISIHGGFSKAIVLTFCIYDKAFKNHGFSIIDGKSQWRFEITIHPRYFERYMDNQFKLTNEFFYVVQQFCIHFRTCDKKYNNHGVNVLLKAIKNALQHAQIHNA